MFAYHSEDPVSSTEMKYHEFRGAKTILLLNSMDKRNVNETGWKKFTFSANNVSTFKGAVHDFAYANYTFLSAME